MTEYVGVDWGSNGWICAVFDEGDWSAHYHPSFLSVWHNHRDAESILVDIPIGLRKKGLRGCDTKAAEKLGSRHQSVFYTPPRKVLDAESYLDAKEEYESLTGRGMTTQAWSFMPRIREVDEFFAEFPEAHASHESAKGCIRESHPEICFLHLTDGEVSASKLRSEGRDERIAVLEGLPHDPAEEFQRLESNYITDYKPHERRFNSANSDDLLDAVGLATVAVLADGNFQTLPEGPSDDERGLPMEIVYTEPSHTE